MATKMEIGLFADGCRDKVSTAFERNEINAEQRAYLDMAIWVGEAMVTALMEIRDAQSEQTILLEKMADQIRKSFG